MPLFRATIYVAVKKLPVRKMNKIKNNIIKTSLLFTMMFSFLGNGYSQSAMEANNPIVEMLDSLVTLNYLQKSNLNSSSNGDYLPHEIPTYSDDIYQKRMEKIQTPIPLTYNSQVKEYIDLYAVYKRGLTERVMGLSNLYFPQFEQVLDQQGLPLEFKYLSIVESALNPTAVSCMGATGLWQFMLATGKMYNLKVNSYIDERKDPVKSTLAACQYFKDMYAIYKDWLLVIASYNCGPGNVNKAIARSGGKTSFWEISPYLPKETRGYVPAFIAVTYLLNYAAEHNLNAVAPAISFYEADTIMIEQSVSLRQVAQSINMSEELLRYLNPIYKKGVIPDSEEPSVLRLPSNKLNAFISNSDQILSPQPQYALLASGAQFPNDNGNFTYEIKSVKKYHKVKRGEHISSIANRYDCSVQEIKRWNKLRSTKLMAGQKLAVYIDIKQKVAVKPETTALVNKPKADSTTNEKLVDANGTLDSAVTDSAISHSTLGTNQSSAKTNQLLGDQKFTYHVVQRGDTLWNIAQRYDGVTVQQLRKVNKLNTNSLKVGTKLKVVVNG